MEELKTLTQLRCKRCGFAWFPRTENPALCPSCKSPYWNRERKAGRPKKAEKCWYCNDTGKRVNLVNNTYEICLNCEAGKNINKEAKS